MIVQVQNATQYYYREQFSQFVLLIQIPD